MQLVTTYRDRPLPRRAALAGNSFLINYFDLPVPLPFELHAVADRNARERADGWTIHPVSRWPGDTVVDHLIFAMKNEPVALRVLSLTFEKMGPDELVAALRTTPGGRFIRRACFFYEWLTGRVLQGLPGVTGPVADAVDTNMQFGATREVGDPGATERRYRVRNNLPGTVDFCPLIARTRKLDAMMARDLPGEARRIVASRSPDMIRRASAYLLLKDSKSSFSIEDETPSPQRAQRWAETIGEAGQLPLSLELLVDLQERVIGDSAFVKLGLREEGGFVGGRSPLAQQPRPDHVSARHEDLPSLIDGLVAFDQRTTASSYHPVLAAASLAFGFVYIHPFEDGNGRIHRWLIHHVLSARGFSPEGLVFPVSTAIGDDIIGYRATLEAISRPMLPWIDWEATEKGNVSVKNETSALYRYFNATRNAEYLFDRICRTIEHDLSGELDFLEVRDAFHREGTRIVDMPERLLDGLFHVLRQNGGSLSKRKRKGIFAKLNDEQAPAFEALYARLTTPRNEEGSAEAEPSLFD